MCLLNTSDSEFTDTCVLPIRPGTVNRNEFLKVFHLNFFTHLSGRPKGSVPATDFDLTLIVVIKFSHSETLDQFH